jgi:hypothetical protein
MIPISMLRQLGLVATVSLIIDMVPLIVAVVYVWRPSETRLALMRPFSLAAVFSGLTGTTVGLAHVFRGLGVTPEWTDRTFHLAAIGASESMVPMAFGFMCLSAAWLLVAVGMRRQDRLP